MAAFTLETVLTSPRLFGLTKATPLQRAICRILDGLPLDDLLEAHPELLAELEATCGPGGFERLPGAMPKEAFIVCGIRNGKSIICAAIAFKAALTADLRILQPHEEAVVSIVSITRDKARIIMRHLTGPLLAQRHLRALMPREPTSSTVWLRRPTDARVVRIQIAAGARAGGSLVGDWSAGALFDEFTRMTGEEDGSVINFDESRKAVLGRIRPGGQLVGVGSPWAPRGAAYEVVKKHWGSPTDKIVVLRPPSRAMNPEYWTDEVIDALRKSPKGEHVYRTDFLGEFADPESNFFTTHELDAVTRKEPKVLPPADFQHFAAIDPGLMRNAFTLVITRREYRKDGTAKVLVAKVRQWVPGRLGPLNPELVMAEIKKECLAYKIQEVFTDRWKSDELERVGKKFGLTITVYGLAGQDSVRLFDSLRLRVLTGGLELPPDDELRADLLAVRRIVRNRTIGMDFPFTNDGRHCDYAPALAVANELAASASSWVHAMKKMREEGQTLIPR